MPSFSYTGISKDGKTVTGSSDATNKQALIALLARQGVRPLVIKSGAGSAKAFRGIKFQQKVKLKELVIFTRQLSTMVSAGVPLTRSLATLQDQTESKYFKQVVAGITKDIESGIPLGDAFAKYPNVFSDVYVNMVRAGEAGGILDDILKRLAGQVEQDSSMRKKIKGAMSYPTVILTITVVAFFGIMVFVMPKLGKIITDLTDGKEALPIYTRAMLSISNFFIGSTIIHSPLLLPLRLVLKIMPIGLLRNPPNALFIIVVLVVAVMLVRRYIKTPRGKFQFHALLLKLPILNNILIKIAVARFARTFASLMSSGVGVLDALEVTGSAMGNKVLEEELRQAAKAVKNGKQLSEPLSASKHFPPIVSQMLSVGEETGQIDTILVKVADFYEEEVDTIIDSLSSIIEPLMIIVLGSLVGLIAASVMGPIANLSKNIGTN